MTPSAIYARAFEDISTLPERGATCLRGCELFLYQTKNAEDVQGPVYLLWGGQRLLAKDGRYLAMAAEAAHRTHFDAGLGQRDMGELDGVVVNANDEVLGRFFVGSWYVELTYLGNCYKEVTATGRCVLKR